MLILSLIASTLPSTLFMLSCSRSLLLLSYFISKKCFVFTVVTNVPGKFHINIISTRIYITKRNCRAKNNSLVIFLFFFFFIWVFFHEHSRFTGQQGKGKGIYLTPLYHFHPLHRHLDSSRAITAESSPLHIASSRTRTGILWFPSASR